MTDRYAGFDPSFLLAGGMMLAIGMKAHRIPSFWRSCGDGLGWERSRRNTQAIIAA
jgi:hypothetical protein